MTRAEMMAPAAATAMRLLYFVGAGPVAMSRVDIAHLFGERMPELGVGIQWYLRSPQAGGAVMTGCYHGQPARLCGRSRLPGPIGRVFDKGKEVLAILHFGGAALTGQHDIVQVRDDFLAGVVGLLAARLARRRFAFWLSYPFPEARRLDAQEGRARWPAYARMAGWLSGWALYRVILPHADIAFVQSAQMKHDLLRPGIDPDRLVPVPMGLPDHEVPSATADSDEGIVLYLGTLARVRRLTTIVEAFAKVHAMRPGSRLVFVGDGDTPADRAELENAVSRLGIAAAVSFTGHLPRRDALAWLARATLCLSPFYPTLVLRSTSPTKLVEYMAAAKPVVANDHPEQAEVIAASGGGLCVPWDVDAFAAAMTQLLDDAALRQSMGLAGRAWALNHRLYSAISKRLLARYTGLVSGSAQDHPNATPP